MREWLGGSVAGVVAVVGGGRGRWVGRRGRRGKRRSGRGQVVLLWVRGLEGDRLRSGGSEGLVL